MMFLLHEHCMAPLLHLSCTAPHLFAPHRTFCTTPPGLFCAFAQRWPPFILIFSDFTHPFTLQQLNHVRNFHVVHWDLQLTQGRNHSGG